MKELSKTPVFGIILGVISVWVDRGDTASRRISVDRLIVYLKKGISIVVAPEGTRNAIFAFQRGPFRLSIETRIPIIPMAVVGADKTRKLGSILLCPGKVNVYFLQAMVLRQTQRLLFKNFMRKEAEGLKR